MVSVFLTSANLDVDYVSPYPRFGIKNAIGIHKKWTQHEDISEGTADISSWFSKSLLKN